MTSTQTGERPPRKPLRLWPGVVAVVLLWLTRFGIKAVVPGFWGFELSAVSGLIGAFLVVVWWLVLSRARWFDRLGGIVLMLMALGGTWLIKHESMGPFWLVGYGIPFLCLFFVLAAVLTRRLPEGRRRLSMAAAILLASGMWALVRTEGINGDHVATFSWRWTATPEKQLLARGAEKPAAASSTAEIPPASTAPLEPRAAHHETEPSAVSPTPATATTTTATKDDAEWPGFRGPNRDGVVRGVRISTDWSRTPPVQLWRRAIGPGWSSFAVSGDLLFTQEQRGNEEVVACYRASTGQPVWTHRDGARFFESNGGAGPRATPTLSQGRVYTFGATGLVNALDAGNGRVMWSHNAAVDTGTDIPSWGFSSSPLVVGDVVIVAAGGQLIAYDLATGRRRWVGPAGAGSYSSPQLVTIDEVAQVLLVRDGSVVSVAPSDGTLLWKYAWSGSTIVQPAVTADQGVLIARMDNGTRRIALTRGEGGWNVEERWTSNALKPYFNDFVVHKGHAIGFDGRILSSIDLTDGSRTWKGGRYGNGQLVLLADQDVLLVLSEEGELALVSATADQFKEVARFPALEGKTWNHPVVVGDILLVRNGEEMAAFRLPLAN